MLRRKLSQIATIVVGVIFVCSSHSAYADITMTVTPHSAPNLVSNTPGWIGYVPNALQGIEDGSNQVGDRESSPTGYQAYAEGEMISWVELLVANFSLWRGEADPSAPFTSEFGNRIHFGLHIVGDGVDQFRLSDLEFESTSTDSFGVFSETGDFTNDNYAAHRIGIDWGANNAKGGGDDTIIASGSGTQLVDEIIYLGLGFAYDASFSPGPGNQQKVFDVFDDIKSDLPFQISVNYTMTDGGGTDLGSASSNIWVVPEPNTLAGLTIIGLIGLVRRQRKS